ncbi:MAG: H-NS family nucleoid-associated regulatory protein [Burkholderiaceae bacterium]
MDELEKALAQLDAVDTSRGALRVEYAGQKGSAPMISADKTAAQGGRKGGKPGARLQADTRGDGKVKDGVAAKRPRKPRAAKANSDAGSGAVADTAVTKRRARGAKKVAAPSAVKYKDPASDKTWSGRGRRPAWLSGDPDHYLVSNLESSSKGNPDAPEPANQTVS